jgi:arylsulfatase A-like enzyme
MLGQLLNLVEGHPPEVGLLPVHFHGEGPGGRQQRRGAKQDLCEGGIRVPLIVRWPGQVKAGKVTAQLAAFWDLLPTFLDAAGLKSPPGLDGVSLLPTLTGRGRQQQHPYLYWEFYEQGAAWPRGGSSGKPYA